MDPHVQPLLEIFDLNTRLFAHCLEGIDDDAAQQRFDDRTNNVTFIAAHLADARYFLAGMIGDAVDNPLAARLKDVRRVEQLSDPPTLAEILSGWHTVTPILRGRLAALTPEALAKKVAPQFPVADRTALGGVAFLLQHESYHLGQLALLRKHLTGKAMSYT